MLGGAGQLRPAWADVEMMGSLPLGAVGTGLSAEHGEGSRGLGVCARALAWAA